MCTLKRDLRICVVVIFACFGLVVPATYAGIPEPGIILYGQVRDDSHMLVTNGELNWTLTPPGAGDPVVITTQLREIQAPGGPFSYAVKIPCETAFSGFPVSDNVIPMTSTAVTYTINAEIMGTSIGMTGYMDISTANRGSIMHISIGPSVITDNDGDSLPDDWEQQIVDGDPNDDITTIEQVFADEDFDGDGFSNLREYLSGSNALYILDIPSCWSDVFFDGDVDAEDFSIFADDFTYHDCPCTFDMDGDGDVDDMDLLFFGEDYGRIDCEY